MGDWYCFDVKDIDGEIVYGFSYQNEKTGWNEVFVQFDEEQLRVAGELKDKIANLKSEVESTIKGWLVD